MTETDIGAPCPFCLGALSKIVRRLAGEKCPTCGHYLTCDTCPARVFCEFADDGYNTDGDCLADK